MANMSYCRFRNTLMDMEDCLDALENGAELEGDELGAYEEMMEIAQRLIDAPQPVEPSDICQECWDPDCEGCE